MRHSLRYVRVAVHSILFCSSGISLAHSTAASRNLVGCTYFTVAMSDSSGDGWNGNFLFLSTSVNVTLSAGAYATTVVCLEEGTYYPYACGGSGDSDVSWMVGGVSGSADDGCTGSSGSFQVGPGLPSVPVKSQSACTSADEDGYVDIESMDEGYSRVLTPTDAGAGCAQGGAFSFVVRKGSSSKVVVEFQGGGACWNYETCSGTDYLEVDSAIPALDCAEWTPTTSAYFGGGLIDSFDDSNPVKDWTYVFVPYCTKDVHVGDDVQMVYTDNSGTGSDVTIRHNGAANAATALNWVKRNFPDPRNILVTGCSAGAIATAIYAPKLSDYYANRGSGASVVAIADSFFLVTHDFVANSVSTWGAECTFWRTSRDTYEAGDEDYSLALWTSAKNTLQTNGHGPVAEVSSLEDATQKSFWAAMNGNPDEFSLRLLRQAAGVSTSYIFAGTSHCTTALSVPFAANDNTFDTWLDALLPNNTKASATVPDSIACAVCNEASTTGCDGVVGSGLETDNCDVCGNTGICNPDAISYVEACKPSVAPTPSPTMSARPTMAPTWAQPRRHKSGWTFFLSMPSLPLEAFIVIAFVLIVGLMSVLLGRAEKRRWSRARRNRSTVEECEANDMPTFLLGFARIILLSPILVIFICVFGTSYLGYKAWIRQPLEFDLDLTSYLSSDGIENDNYVFVQTLVDDTSVCSSSLEADAIYQNVSASKGSRRLNEDSSYQIVRLLYSSPEPITNPSNVLTATNMALARDLEADLQCSQNYETYCLKDDDTDTCTAAASLAPVFFVGGLNAIRTCPPEEGKMLSTPFQSIVDAIAQANVGEGFLETSFSTINPESTVMISHFVFLGDPSKLIPYLTNDLLPDMLSRSTGDFRVSVWNSEIYDYSVLQALAYDSRLAAIGFVLVVSVVAHTSRSGLLTVAAFLCMLLSLPLAYWTYTSCLSITRTPLLNFFGMFVVVGIGCDGVFLLINTYDEFNSNVNVRSRSVSQELHSRRDVLLLSKVYKRAGSALLAATVTTAGSFFANIASALPVLREFGQFVGLLVICNYVFLMTLFMAALHISKTTDCCQCNCCSKCCSLAYCCPCCKGTSHGESSANPDTMAGNVAPSETLKVKRVRSVAKVTSFVQRHRFACTFVPLLGTFALFGWTLLHIQGASDPPQLFHEQHNLGVAYELFGTVASRNLADASSSNDYSGSASDGYSVPNIIYPTTTPVLEPTPRPVSQPSPEPTSRPTHFPTPKPTTAGVVVSPQPTVFPLPYPTPQPSRQRNSTAPTMQPTSPAAKSTVDVTLLWDLRNVRDRSGSRDGDGSDGMHSNSSDLARTLDEAEQALLLATCEAVYRDPRLQVVRSSSTCFMEDLNFFLQGRFEESLPLPPSDFKSAALVFYYRASRSDYARPDCDRDGDLMWVKAEFKTRMPINIPFNEIEAFFDGWQDFVAEANANYTAAAGLKSEPPVLRISSWDWVAASTESRLVESTAWAFVISLGISVVCIFAFTGRKVGTTLAAFLCILSINLALITGMVLGLQWTLGAIEAVSITVFVGFSVDYALHMSTAFASPSLAALALAAESRNDNRDAGLESALNNNEEAVNSRIGNISGIDSNRVDGNRNSLMVVQNAVHGDAVSNDVLPSEVAAWRAAECIVELRGSILGAALTTCVAAGSLIGCTIQIFVKMGITLMACTVLSAIFALLVLPGFLLCFAERDAQLSKSMFTPNSNPSHEEETLEVEDEDISGMNASDGDDIDMNVNANNDSTFINNAALRAELGLAPRNSVDSAVGAVESLPTAPTKSHEGLSSLAARETPRSSNQIKERTMQSSNARRPANSRTAHTSSLDRPMSSEVELSQWRPSAKKRPNHSNRTRNLTATTTRSASSARPRPNDIKTESPLNSYRGDGAEEDTVGSTKSPHRNSNFSSHIYTVTDTIPARQPGVGGASTAARALQGKQPASKRSCTIGANEDADDDYGAPPASTQIPNSPASDAAATATMPYFSSSSSSVSDFQAPPRSLKDLLTESDSVFGPPSPITDLDSENGTESATSTGDCEIATNDSKDSSISMI